MGKGTHNIGRFWKVVLAVATVVSAVATLLVVPEVRDFIGLETNSVKGVEGNGSTEFVSASTGDNGEQRLTEKNSASQNEAPFPKGLNMLIFNASSSIASRILW